MSNKIKVEDILAKHRYEGTICSWSDDNVKEAIKEIVEAVIDEVAKEAKVRAHKMGGINSYIVLQKELSKYELNNTLGVRVDKDSILNAKKMIDYE